MADAPDLEVSAPQGQAEADVMNDPRYATNMAEADGDADTCRICRGEGGESEPLFHPCKCSGSIKFVHQDCLMEWLSHSQKKHCELCKTAFRFTKLYSPNMPQSLPLPVLLHHVLLHSVKNMATWLRGCLVITVWLAALPYVIRQVWRLLFWFSDGGWPPNYLEMNLTANSTSTQAIAMARELQALAAGNGTSPVTPLQSVQTTSASVGGVVEKLMGFLMPLNVSGVDPLPPSLFKSLYYGFGVQNSGLSHGSNTNASGDPSSMNLYSISQTPSLLSEVGFLRNMTRSPYVNDLIIMIAEGYVITILVVVCFILIFLIREWVVQQQPGINMGAGFNAEFAPADRDQPAAPEVRVDGPRRALDINELGDAGNRRENAQDRPIAQVRRRRNVAIHGGDVAQQETDREPQPEDDAGDEANPSQRPIPVRDALSPAAEIQRALTEEPRMTEEFLAIWRRADSDPQEVLRIIERENKGDQMRYWVNAMKILQNPNRSVHTPHASLEASRVDDGNESDNYTQGRNEAQPQTESDKSSASSESWVDVPQIGATTNQNPETETSGMDSLGSEPGLNNKGKEKEIKNNDSESHSITPGTRQHLHNGEDDPGQPFSRSSEMPGAPGPCNDQFDGRQKHISRPRSVSDGPQAMGGISALGSNSWDFRGLEVDLSDKDHGSSPGHKDKGLFTSPDNAKQKPLEGQNQAWKAAQDLRVQQAFAKSKEAHKTALEGHTPAPFGQEIPAEVTDQDGVSRTFESWDNVNANHPISDSDSEFERDGVWNTPEVNPFNPEAPLPAAREPIVARPAEPRGLLENAADFMWGGVGDDAGRDDQGGNVEHIVQDLAAEAPFVPVVHENQMHDEVDFPAQDREVVEAAMAAGVDPNDADAIDDAEDFEGMMELVGMRGPIFSLLQNALFSAFLLALTVAFGVWIPYNIGRVSLLLIANPGPAFKLPLRLVFWSAAFLQDMALSVLGVMSWCLITLISVPLKLWSNIDPATNTDLVIKSSTMGSAALDLTQGAVERVIHGTLSSLDNIAKSEIFTFSAASHESLWTLQNLILDTFTSIGSTAIHLLTGNYTIFMGSIWSTSFGIFKESGHAITLIPTLLAKPDSWVISLELGKRLTPLDPALSVWNGTDRFWAIASGYAALCLLGGLYVRKGSPFSNGQVGREWEASIIDLLNQAGGVFKVILIISIEMLVFPLYCELLLDAALLPLFEHTTLMSRFQFTLDSPLTSIFVHWFVGTCYMFHFALFVSMCRKIMRRGVLYFIRDPDDPTFHPVRDVLERNLATQLRKILFSALVYGGLVVICLGSVVWGLAYAFKGVLPIHWSSNEPVLEFPIDLLFYNFLMPLAVKFFKPSDGLHVMYSWWFRQCARMLRLTWFMFDERKQDEEGYHVRRSWTDVLRGVKADSSTMTKSEDVNEPFAKNPGLRAYYRTDGRYVRAPASDQVRIPKGTAVFLEVDEANNRVDGKEDKATGPHSKASGDYKQVYIPPNFRLRITLFIVSIWLFAALTGVCITIVPLVFGRQVFAKIIPAHVRKNDVYAFSIGIYILGSVLYAALHMGRFINYLREALAFNADTPQIVLRRVGLVTSRLARVAWTYTAFLFILPTLFAFLVEFYFIVPLHTYFAYEERHVVHFVQSWTLGLLYVKLTTRFILWHQESRPAQSLRAITRDGYFNPDAWLATRSFILPVGLALTMALFAPWAFARAATQIVFRDSPERHVLVYRYAYPMYLAMGIIGFALYVLLGRLKKWRMKIRDEVYLIGERLHNFGDRKTGSPGLQVPSVRRVET